MVTVKKAGEDAAAEDGSTVIYTSPSDATCAAQIPFELGPLRPCGPE
jgi:rhamnose transport system substrate-binding protein